MQTLIRLLCTHQPLYNTSRLVGKPTMWFPNRSDTNRPVQAQKRARCLKFRIEVEEELYYPSSENKGADQLRGYREAGLRLCFRICKLLVFSCTGSNCKLCKPSSGCSVHLNLFITLLLGSKPSSV